MLLWNMEVKGTRLRVLFQFLASIIQDKIITLHLSADAVRCSEVSHNKRLLFNYILFSTHLVNYEYNYSEPTRKIKFELRWILEKLQDLKIKQKIRMYITSEEPDYLIVNIYGDAKTQKDKKIKLSLSPNATLQEPPLDRYYENPLTVHKEDFLPFLKLKPTMKNGKVVREEVEVKIQTPNFIKFTRSIVAAENEKYGIMKKDKPLFKGNYFINEIKNIFKLHPSTSIFNIYQPKDDLAPFFISGLAGEFGSWSVFIHQSNVKPIIEKHV